MKCQIYCRLHHSRTCRGRDWHLSRLVSFFSVTVGAEDNPVSCVAVSDIGVEIRAALKQEKLANATSLVRGCKI